MFTSKEDNTIIFSILTFGTCIVGCILSSFVLNRFSDIVFLLDNMPSLYIPKYVNILDASAIIASLLSIIVCFIIWVTRRAKIVVPIALAILLILLAAWVIFDTSFEAYLVKNHATSDLSMGGPTGFHPISLYEFEELFNLKDKKADIPLYIGRLDCKDCESFEKAMAPFLESKELGFAMYNTSSDRDGPNSKAMYEFLEEKEIASVPLYIVIQDGKIIKCWDEPEKDIKEIEAYLTEHLKEELN